MDTADTVLPHTALAESAWVTAQSPSDWLTADELTVFSGWRSEKRRAEWLAGRLAAKRLMRDALGWSPAAWQIGRDGAAPAILGADLPGVVLSLSHSDGMGAATLSDTRTEGSAGIDLQRIRPVHPGLCARVFSQEERGQIARLFGAESDPAGMLLLWALKEAAIKARRQPWGRPLQSLQVRCTRPGFAEVATEASTGGEIIFPAQYARIGDWWVARAIQPPSRV